MNRTGLWLLFMCLVAETCLAQSSPTDSVVTIYCKSRAGGSSQGTGFVFGSQGFIVTAYHVVQNAEQIDIYDSSFSAMDNVVVEQIDTKRDIAILKSSSSQNITGLRPVGNTPLPHANVSVAGSPRGLPKQVLYGRLSGEGTVPSSHLSDGGPIFAEDLDVYPVDVTIYSGMSGAPLLSSDNSVIGVFSGSYTEGRGIGWAIPIKYALDLMSQPQMGRRADQIGAWPSLTLMNSRWISLKRSYDQPFAPEHIAELEILEQARRTLNGRWKAHIDQRESQPYVIAGACQKMTIEDVDLSFEDIDDVNAKLMGHMMHTTATASLLTPKIDDPDSLVTVQMQVESCNNSVFSKPDLSRTYLSLRGTTTFEIGDVEAFPEKKALIVKLNVTDCDGNTCSASLYGGQKAEALELISPSKVRWGKYILEKY